MNAETWEPRTVMKSFQAGIPRKHLMWEPRMLPHQHCPKDGRFLKWEHDPNPPGCLRALTCSCGFTWRRA